MAEMRGFVFSVMFIILFSAFLTSVPVGLLGTGSTPNALNPIDASLYAGFSSSVSFDPTDFSAGTYSDYYEYELGVGVYWVCKNYYGADRFVSVGREIRYAGFWFGQEARTDCITKNGTVRDGGVFLSEVLEDSDEGTVQYNLRYSDSGNSAGGLIFYWNVTEYTDPQDAWDSNELYIMHGQGINETAGADIASLLLSLLTLQLPNVPVLLGIILASPFYACTIFVVWFIIKETLPFV